MGLFPRVFGILTDEETWHAWRMRKPRRLVDAYRFPGFRPEATVRGLFGDPKARVLRLVRRRKKRSVAPAGRHTGPSTTARPAAFATFPAATPRSTWR